MAENQSAEERTEKPTPKRLKEAREKGQVPRSRELTTLLMLLASAGTLLLVGDGMIGRLALLMRQGFSLERATLMDERLVPALFAHLMGHGILLMAPLLAVLTVVAFLAPLSLGGWTFSAKAVAFKLEKLDPVKGLGRIFSSKGLMELGKTLAKFALVVAASGAVFWSHLDQLLLLDREPLRQALAHAGTLCLWTFLLISAVLLLVAAVDVPFQLWQHNKQLKMTLKEVRDEQKETEGSPEVRGRIRSIQREMARKRMMDAVPTADVVVTNPTHYAVALKYDRDGDAAPKVVAKGADLVAQQIRSIAQAAGVAVVSAPPLARALHALVEIDQEIPAELYLAVAHVLAYVYQLDAARRSGAKPPPPPTDLPVPEAFRNPGAPGDGVN